MEVALGLGLTPSSYGLFKKLRYDDVGPVPFFRKVLDPRAVARRRLGRGWARVGRARRSGPRWRLARPERPRPARDVAVAAARRRSRAEYDALWERARGSYAMCVRRDRGVPGLEVRGAARTGGTTSRRRAAAARSPASR